MPPPRHKPLFDLIPPTPKGQPAPRVEPMAAPSPSRVEMKPRDPVWSAPAPRVERLSPEPTPEPAGAGSLLGRATISVRTNLLWVALAAAVLVVVGAWWGGVSWGRSRAIKDLEPFRQEGAPPIREPGAPGSSPLIAGSTTNTEPARTPEPGRDPGGASPATGPSPHGPESPASPGGNPSGITVLTARGFIADPREAGLNYLALATLARTEAERAIAFLADSGVEAFGVPVVERGRAGANNPGPAAADAKFRVFAARGISGEEYSQNRTVKTNLEAAVARIGAQWQRDHRGSSNFAKPLWEKFDPK